MISAKRKSSSKTDAVRVERSGARNVNLYRALTSDSGRSALNGIIELGRDAAHLRGFKNHLTNK